MYGWIKYIVLRVAKLLFMCQVSWICDGAVELCWYLKLLLSSVPHLSSWSAASSLHVPILHLHISLKSTKGKTLLLPCTHARVSGGGEQEKVGGAESTPVQWGPCSEASPPSSPSLRPQKAVKPSGGGESADVRRKADSSASPPAFRPPPCAPLRDAFSADAPLLRLVTVDANAAFVF